MNYKEKKCTKCGKTYQPNSSTQQWCSECLIKKCEYCGKEFSVGKKSKYNTTKFCSRECKGKYNSENCIGKNATNYKNGNRTKIKIVCDNCGKETLKEKQHVDKWKHNFCNRNCQIEFYRKEENKIKGENNPKYSKVTVRCEWCGKSYKTYRCTKDKVRFCSKKCRNDWQSDMMKGEKHYNWQGGTSGARALDMASREYKNWRKAVFKRDKYTCQLCGDNKGGNLRAHHIKEYAKYPELRHVISNGITLCEACHIKVHSKEIELDIQSELAI